MIGKLLVDQVILSICPIVPFLGGSVDGQSIVTGHLPRIVDK